MQEIRKFQVKENVLVNGVARPLDLKLVDVTAFPGGIVAHTYHPD